VLIAARDRKLLSIH